MDGEVDFSWGIRAKGGMLAEVMEVKVDTLDESNPYGALKSARVVIGRMPIDCPWDPKNTFNEGERFLSYTGWRKTRKNLPGLVSDWI